MVAESTHVTPSQAARLLGVARRTIYRMLDSGRLIPTRPSFKTLISREQVDKLISIAHLKIIV